MSAVSQGRTSVHNNTAFVFIHAIIELIIGKYKADDLIGMISQYWLPEKTLSSLVLMLV